MLRQKLRGIVVNKKNHPLIKKVSRVLIVVGLLWILSFPYISRNVFTSENALNTEFMETQFNLDGTAYSVFKQLQDQIKSATDPSKHHRDFILQRLGHQAEVYIQELQSKKGKSNLYSYIRSPRGYGNECNLLAMPLNHKASVVTGLAFIETWIRRQPNWQSKDLLILFYEDLDYALGVREFLENYYYQGQDQTNQQIYFKAKIEGRCGYIRQAYAFVLPDYDFNKYSVFLDGMNAQYSDIDFYDATKDALNRLEWKYDFGLPYYFQQNSYLDKVMKFFTQNVRSYFVSSLDTLTRSLFEQEANSKGTILQMLESIKNQYVGKPHYPHSHMIEYGIHSMTFKATTDSKAKPIGERDRVLKTLGLMEAVFRMNDQLDEQLHAGYYFYLLTSKTTFVSNSGFVYPIVVILAGYFISNFIQYQEYINEPAQGGQDKDMLTSFLFIGLSYILGFAFMMTPNLYMEYKGSKNIRSELCLANKDFKNEVATVTLMVIGGSIIAYQLLFKVLQHKNSTNLWFSIKSHYWWPNLVFAGSLVVYQFSHSLVMSLFVFPLVQVSTYIGQSPLRTVVSIFSLFALLSLNLMLLFGSQLSNPQYYGLPAPKLDNPHSILQFAQSLLQNLARDSILDYDCAGSNVWIYICLHIIPSFIILTKIFTN